MCSTPVCMVVIARSEAMKQSIPSLRGGMDCFAEPVIGRAFARPVGSQGRGLCNHQLHTAEAARSIRVNGAYIHKAVMLGEAMRAAANSPSAKSRRRAIRAPAAKPYHHGDLRRVLIDAALQLVGEGGAERLSVREAARRAGVSPGAPFRHFPSRDALIKAVAEEAQRRFQAEIEQALADAPADDPLGRFRRIGIAYLRWATRNPTHFEIISNRRFFDHDKAPGVSQDNGELIDLSGQTLAEAFAAGQLRTLDLKQVQID